MYDNEANNKLVSVIVPVYNAEKFICQTLDSIIGQDYPEKEIIIVDDCSTDNSFNIIKEYVKNNSCITYQKLGKNSGVAVARNTAIEIAKGRYVAFLDSDDIWEQGKLSQQLNLFYVNKGCPFTYTAISYIDENGRQIKGKRKLKERVSYQYLLHNTIVATSTVIVDREIVTNIVFPNRKSAEDYSLWLSMLKTYGDAFGIDEAFTRYRKTHNSISASRFGEVKYFIDVQKNDFNLNTITILYNTICYAINAFIKHYL